MGRRTLNWSAELSAFKADRAARSEVREERLRTRGTPGMALSAWRGQSGRRYVVGVHPATAATFNDLDVQDCVIFVRRSAHGTSTVVGCASSISPYAAERAEVLRDALREGANEIHVHRLCESDAERRAFVADLTQVSEAA
jgi:hypothetical protein